MSEPARTPLYGNHVALKAKMVDFSGWEMPLFYPSGIITEHLATRRSAGLFDVSHMGRLVFRGPRALEFLQKVLTNNAAALDVGQAQYTIIPTPTGGALDDAYLYRFVKGEYLLVVNASNRGKDVDHFRWLMKEFDGVEMTDRTDDLVMISLQGPESRRILREVIEHGRLPEPQRNQLSIVRLVGAEVMVARTGYTGEPLCFELFAPKEVGPVIWDLLIERGARPVGLGARDTLRLEAGLPLYGHEFGVDPDGAEIPLMSVPIARFAVSFALFKGIYVGREPISKQVEAFQRNMRRDFTVLDQLPRTVRPFAMVGRGVGRAGAKVFRNGKHAGYVTSGTTVPYWVQEGEGLSTVFTDEQKIRAIGLALIDSDIQEGESVEIEVRGKMVEAVVTPYHMRGDAPPFARPIVYEPPAAAVKTVGAPYPDRARTLLDKAAANTVWRQTECINLIPSEMTVSPMTRLLSVMDPAFRYAEHRKAEAFYDADIFFYQGVEFIAEVERLLEEELRRFLGCPQVETRLVSGQMANMAVYSAILDYINRTNRKVEPRRIRMVMNNHIGKGGHLSAQPMGALKDFVAHDPRTERPAAVNFPVLDHDRFRIDVPLTLELIEQNRPELIIFGKSMVLYREPVAEIRQFLDERKIDSLVMYDMAHVLGLIGPHFQEPFKDGADLVTGSTHKTYFGSQRGVVGGRFELTEERWELWEALRRRTFPGSVSNHHLGTLLGLLMASYEMNHFKDQYQPRVVANAKAFARALKAAGLDVAGDPKIGYTETHQVIVNVEYAKGPEFAARLEKNNVITNFQAGPEEEGFTASGALRLGVSEMTRFGMDEDCFADLAGLMADVILRDADVKEKVKAMRQDHLDLCFCFKGEEYEGVMRKLHRLI